MLENDTTEFLLRQINGSIKCAMDAHPEFGLKGKHIGSVSKRIAAGLVGEIIEDARRSIREVVTKEFVYQEIQKENEMLREKIETVAKSNRYLLNKLRDNNISL